MLHIIAGLSVLGTFRPYLRKHITQDINPWEFMFINSVIIGILSFIYCYFHKKEKISNLFTLSTTQYLAALIISGLTIVSSLVYLSMEKDNVLTSSFLWRGISAVAFVAVGFLLFKEKVTMTQMMGIIAIILGSFLVASDAGGD
jgi:uncharacterized membrane protein